MSIKKNITLIVCVLLIAIFIALSFKKVYTSDTLIPNLEPYPDALYYATPAWNFVHGNGFVMKTQNVLIKQQTPPLLSLYLIPFFAVFKNVRSFYFANMLLAVATIIFFVRIIHTVFLGKTIYKGILTFFLGFFLVTNFYFYSIPQLLMAEPITMFLVTLGMYIFLSKPHTLHVFTASQIGFLLVLVKLSNIPYAVVLTILLFLKFLNPKTKRATHIRLFMIGTGISVVYFVAYLFSSKLLIHHKNLQSGTDFNISHLKKGIEIYANTLLGKQGIRYVWFTEKFMPTIIAYMSVCGIVVSMFTSLFRRNALVFLSVILSVVSFMSFFVTQDLRYIIAILPLYLLFIGFVIHAIFLKTNATIATVCMCIILISSLVFKTQGYKENERAIVTFKKQIGLNIRHREVPWNYEAIQIFNQFTKNADSHHTYIGTFLPPPFIEIFSNKKYQTLPISSWQEFYWLEPLLLKQVVGDNVVDRYKKLLQEGNEVYITHYYENNVPSQWPMQFNELTSNFLLNKVYDGCLGACDIYKLTLPDTFYKTRVL